jgi:O-antigen/teichoic acid export membrane protein
MANNWDKIKNISSLKGITNIGISDIIGSGISSALWFYLASLMTTESYGQISFLIAIGGIVSTISLVGAVNTITVHTAKNIKTESTLYITSLIITSVSAIIVAIILYNIEIMAYIFGAVIFGLSSSEILGRKLYKSYSKYIIAQKLLMVVLVLVLYNLIGINGVILGLGLAFLPYSFRIYKGFKETKIDFALLKNYSGFITHNYIATLVYLSRDHFDKIIIVPILGFAILGNYALAIQLLAILEIIPGIIFKFILPHDATGNPNKKLKQITILFSIGIAGLGVVVSPIIIPILFPKYIEAVQIFQIVSLSIIPTTINYTIISKILGLEKSRILLISSIIYIASQTTLMVVLGKIYGVNGVAIAYVMGTSVYTVILLYVDKFVLEKN